MSTETYEAMEHAIRAHLSDETDGGLLKHWIVAAAGASAADRNETVYQYANHDGSPHEWVGLLWMANRRAERWDAVGDDE